VGYLPIENHGIIGNLRTCALVGIDGTIDWLCLPHFDSPSVFASILDDRKGGFFRISASSSDARRRQMYLPDTNVLLTRFLTPDGVGEVVDFMPVHAAGERRARAQRIVRMIRGIRGSIPFELVCRPAFDYGRSDTKIERIGGGYRMSGARQALDLRTDLPLEAEHSGLTARFTLEPGSEIAVVLSEGEGDPPESGTGLHRIAQQDFRATVAYWQSWISRSQYRGHWREMVKRSCLTLKLLTYAPTGAIVAAPTASLPERIGGGRNWDYRYTWIRDAAFTLYGLIRVGFTEEAHAFMKFLEARCRELEPGQGLDVLYAIDGRRDVPEEMLSHLEGYRGSAPVRVGNAAAQQFQLDITGELIDSIYLYNKYCRPISYDLWDSVRMLADWVCENWKRDDDGIWEIRGGRRPFTFSKLMCWVALDRSQRLAVKRSLPGNRHRWLDNRDELYEAIMTRGFSKKKQAFVQALDTDDLDASLLLAPLVRFVSPSDPRMLSTLDAVGRELVSDHLVHRYDPKISPDGVGGREGTFSMCTFWLAEATARAGRLSEARLIFEKMLGYANHLGLYSEEIGPTGEQLGNFPQAFTHLGLISAAHNISRALDGNLDGVAPPRSGS
jgi:GH15 family glucan-1,4-alpha-glucosidase